MTIKHDENRIILHQSPTPYWKLEANIQFEISEPHTIDITMEFTPQEIIFDSRWFGSFSRLYQPTKISKFLFYWNK